MSFSTRGMGGVREGLSQVPFEPWRESRRLPRAGLGWSAGWLAGSSAAGEQAGWRGLCFLPPGSPSLWAQTWPVTSADGSPLALGGVGCGAGAPGARAACSHGAISIRAWEPVAAAPGILLKAFSLFPAICSAPPGPGHVDNLFVEGTGGEEHRGGEGMSLFTQPAFCG